MPQHVDAPNTYEAPETFLHRGADQALRVRRPALQDMSTIHYSRPEAQRPNLGR